MKTEPEIAYLPEGFARGAADRIEAAAVESLATRGHFRLGLCGGSSPKPVFADLAARPLPWEKVWITFGDERCVPPDHADSNYRMAREQLLGRVPIPAGNVLRMRGELHPEEAAADYGRELAGRAAESGETRYAHDLLLLGLGEDGHTASLFPGTAALAEAVRDVAENFVPKLGAHRITLTYPQINAARRVMFLVGDPSKRRVVEEILAGGSGHPAEGVSPVNGRLAWLLGWREEGA